MHLHAIKWSKDQFRVFQTWVHFLFFSTTRQSDFCHNSSFASQTDPPDVIQNGRMELLVDLRVLRWPAVAPLTKALVSRFSGNIMCPQRKGENLGTLDSFRHWIGCMQAEKDARQITQLEVHVISSQTKPGLLIGLCMLCRAK